METPMLENLEKKAGIIGSAFNTLQTNPKLGATVLGGLAGGTIGGISGGDLKSALLGAGLGAGAGWGAHKYLNFDPTKFWTAARGKGVEFREWLKGLGQKGTEAAAAGA